MSTRISVGRLWPILCGLTLIVTVGATSTPVRQASRDVSEDAQGDECGCSTALKKDFAVHIKTTDQAVSWLRTADDTTLHEVMTGSDTSVGIAKILSGSHSENADEKNYRKFEETMFFDGAKNDQMYDLKLITNPIAYGAWKSCMQQCATRKPGFYVFKESEDADVITVTALYQAPPAAHPTDTIPPIPLSGEIVNGWVKGARPGEAFPHGALIGVNGKVTILIHRDPKKEEVEALISAGGYGGRTIVSRYVPSIGVAQVAYTHLAPDPSTRTDKQVTGVSAEGVDNQRARPGDTCTDPDGVWKAADLTLTVTAAPGHVLGNPRSPVYVGMPPTAAALINQLRRRGGPYSRIADDLAGQYRNVGCFSKLLSLSLNEERTAATAKVRTWSKPGVWRFVVDDYEMTQQPVGRAGPTYTLVPGHTILVPVPKTWTASLISTITGSMDTMKVDPIGNGRFQYVSETGPSGPVRYYTYRVVGDQDRAVPTARRESNQPALATR